MVSKVTLFCIVFVVFAAIQATSALKCYHNTEGDAKGKSETCEAPKDKSCFKYKKEDDWNRGCTEIETKDQDKFCKEGEGKDSEKCEICNKDECNSGSFIVPSIILSVSALLLVKYF